MEDANGKVPDATLYREMGRLVLHAEAPRQKKGALDDPARLYSSGSFALAHFAR